MLKWHGLARGRAVVSLMRFSGARGSVENPKFLAKMLNDLSLLSLERSNVAAMVVEKPLD